MVAIEKCSMQRDSTVRWQLFAKKKAQRRGCTDVGGATVGEEDEGAAAAPPLSVASLQTAPSPAAGTTQRYCRGRVLA